MYIKIENDLTRDRIIFKSGEDTNTRVAMNVSATDCADVRHSFPQVRVNHKSSYKFPRHSYLVKLYVLL